MVTFKSCLVLGMKMKTTDVNYQAFDKIEGQELTSSQVEIPLPKRFKNHVEHYARTKKHPPSMWMELDKGQFQKIEDIMYRVTKRKAKRKA